MSITVKSFSSEAEANLAMGLLHSRGIHATVNRFSRYRSMAGGGWQLRVAQPDHARAMVVLKEASPEIDMDEYVDADDTSYRRCPRCNSVNVKADPLSPRLQLIASLGLGIPLLFIHRNWTCAKCGDRWKSL